MNGGKKGWMDSQTDKWVNGKINVGGVNGMEADMVCKLYKAFLLLTSCSWRTFGSLQSYAMFCFCLIPHIQHVFNYCSALALCDLWVRICVCVWWWWRGGGFLFVCFFSHEARRQVCERWVNKSVFKLLFDSLWSVHDIRADEPSWLNIEDGKALCLLICPTKMQQLHDAALCVILDKKFHNWKMCNNQKRYD